MQTLRRTQQLVSAYANGDTWEDGYDESQACLDIKENLAWGVQIFDGLKAVDARLHSHFLEHPGLDSTIADDAILECYRIFMDACLSHLVSAEKYHADGSDVEGYAELSLILEEVTCLVENAEYAKNILPVEVLLAELRPENPCPDRYLD